MGIGKIIRKIVSKVANIHRRKDTRESLRAELGEIRKIAILANSLREFSASKFQKTISQVLTGVSLAALDGVKNTDGIRRTESIGELKAIDNIELAIKAAIKKGDEALQREQIVNEKLAKLERG